MDSSPSPSSPTSSSSPRPPALASVSSSLASLSPASSPSADRASPLKAPLLPSHERISLPSNSEDLVSIYGSNPQGQVVDELEDVFYEEEFDPIKYILESIPDEGGDSTYFDKQAWLARTILKLDTHLLGVCQTFNEESYLTVIDAYALMGDIGGMAEKMQSFFLQEVLSRTHFVLKDMLEEIASEGLKHRVFEVSFADLEGDEDQAYRKIRLRVEDVQGKNVFVIVVEGELGELPLDGFSFHFVVVV